MEDDIFHQYDEFLPHKDRIEKLEKQNIRLAKKLKLYLGILSIVLVVLYFALSIKVPILGNVWLAGISVILIIIFATKEYERTK